MYDKEFYGKVYDLLVSQGQIKRNPDWLIAEKESFAIYFAEKNGTEWRFCGDLGFGGKFWHNGGRHYVSCYVEDSSPKTEAIIFNLNAAIFNLELEHGT